MGKHTITFIDRSLEVAKAPEYTVGFGSQVLTFREGVCEDADDEVAEIVKHEYGSHFTVQSADAHKPKKVKVVVVPTEEKKDTTVDTTEVVDKKASKAADKKEAAKNPPKTTKAKPAVGRVSGPAKPKRRRNTAKRG